jgi:hypothetical protein
VSSTSSLAPRGKSSAPRATEDKGQPSRDPLGAGPRLATQEAQSRGVRARSKPHGYVLTTSEGTPLYRRNVGLRGLKNAADNAGPQPRPSLMP